MMDLRSLIRKRLEETTIMTLAVQDERGPWSTPVIFSYQETREGFVLYFMSRTQTRHVQAFSRSPWIAASLHPGTTRPLRGLQMEGPVHPINLRELPGVLKNYGRRFPQAIPHIPGKLLKNGTLRFFAFTPTWFGILDEENLGWGVREVWEVSHL